MRYLPVLAALALLVAYGVAEGLWTNRWVESHEVEQAVDRLKAIPKTIGAWEGHDRELTARTVARAEMDGYVLRQYVNKKTGQAVQVLLVCGRPRPTSQHSPEVCYEGAGYTQDGDKQHQEIKVEGREQPAQFWVARFKKTGAMPDPLRIAWSWSATGNWLAPSDPRVDFAWDGVLYKLYVSHLLAGMDEPREDPNTDFLKVFLPELGKCLFPAAEPRAGKT